MYKGYRKKHIAYRAAAVLLSALLAMSAPISALADEDTVQTQEIEETEQETVSGDRQGVSETVTAEIETGSETETETDMTADETGILTQDETVAEDTEAADETIEADRSVMVPDESALPEEDETAEIEAEADSTALVRAFVMQMYTNCLNRQPDSAGLASWTEQLVSGKKTAAQVAYSFMFSTEFKNLNLCNSCFMDRVYETLLGREADASGKATYVKMLNTGTAREAVFNSFIASSEFKALCQVYGITPGSAVSYTGKGTRAQGPCSECGALDPVTQFVSRLYDYCLDRRPDEAGLASWCSQLYAGTKTGVQVAWAFFNSTEFKNRTLCNGCYVDYLYKAMMGRVPDSAGRASWVAKLDAGASRAEVFNGFAMSSEFAKICATYLIDQGSKVSVPSSHGDEFIGMCPICGAVGSVAGFVTRLYKVCLDRSPDAAGLASWTKKLTSGSITGAEAAGGFIFSQEFLKNDYTDEDFVEKLYEAMMGRSADASGKANWVAKLESGLSRKIIFACFVSSAEFGTICSNAGVTKGKFPGYFDGIWSWPCSSTYISSYFGGRVAPTAGASSDHKGMDIAATSGTPIWAASGGTVVNVAYSSVRGYYVDIDHGNGIVTRYQHMKSAAIVEEGDKVVRGQTVGYVGSTGVSTGAHLHIEFLIDDVAVDPLNYLTEP